MDEFGRDDFSLERGNLFSFDGNSNASLSNLLLSDKGSSIQDYLDVSIDLNSVFDLRSSTPEKSEQQQLHNTINTPIPPDHLDATG